MALVNNTKILGFFEPLVQLLFPVYQVNGYRAKVLGFRDENCGVYTLVLKVSRHWKGFKAGQHIELGTERDGVKISRIFSISSAPLLYKTHRIIELTIQKQAKGRMTPWYRSGLKVGHYVSITQAQGDFIIENPNQEFLFIAAGSGITPLLSMLEEHRSTANVHLMYYAKVDKHLFNKELNKYQKLGENIKITLINSTQSGRFCQQHLEQYCPDYVSRKCYICGPSEMIVSTEKLLLNQNVQAENIGYEYFTAKPLSDLNINTAGKVSFKQSSLEVETNANNQTLLELAESKGLKPITGCRMGICHQCICQKNQGVIYNTLTNTYSDTGSEEVQLCISMPVGDVSINL
jgi:ferredoxin-NADP reductase